jgi:hypothetical protein
MIDNLNHLLLSDVNKLLNSLVEEFPQVFKLYSIGDSYEGRPMMLLEIDARDYLFKD